MAKKPKRPVGYDLKAADRKRSMLIQGGLTAIVVIFAVVLVLVIVVNKDEKSGDVKAIRVTTSKLITNEGTSEPKAVLQLYEDFLCPACANFENAMAATVATLIDTGAVAADYYMVAILDRPQNANYSSRAGAAGYCVADESTDAFRRFHAALYTQGIQPSEAGSTFPDNAQLIELARQAGAAGSVPDCVNSGKYLKMVEGMAKAADINSTPTIRINGEDYEWSTPQALIDKIKSIVGNVPGLEAPAPAPAPAPTPAPPPAPAPAGP